MTHAWDCKNLIEWTNLDLQNETIKVSNPDTVLPHGLTSVPDFLTEEEASSLLNELDQYHWNMEGFAQKKRVQRYQVKSDDLPERLEQLMIRFQAQTNLQPQHVIVEEYPFQAATRTTTNAVVTTFESNLQECDPQDSFFVGQIAIACPAVEHLNRPRKRLAECWQLESPNHWTDIRMDPRTLFLKTDEALLDWRNRLTRSPECDPDDKVVIVKFYNLPEDEPRVVVPPVKPDMDRLEEMPPLDQILTLIVTTSPIKSHPSTEVLERTFDTFAFGGPEFMKCRKVIVCDGLRVQDGSVTKKHSNAKQALRNGIATSLQADNYTEFKTRLAQLCQEATADSPFCNTTIEELTTRHGYGFALRHALRNCVTTPYVCVIQHDRTFMRTTPMEKAVKAMWHHPRVKYIGVSMRSNLIYRDIFMSKYGKPAHDDLGQLVLRLPELVVDAAKYGPDSESVQSMTVPTEKLRTNLESVKETYMASAHNAGQREWLIDNPLPEGRHQMTLTPTIFWYDNTHIVETAHYRDFIFNPQFKMVARGGFVEDKTSPVIAKAVERLGLAAGHEKFGCYLLDDHSGFFFNGHLDGGSYIPQAEKERQFGVTSES
jgi:hypothetical protein